MNHSWMLFIFQNFNYFWHGFQSASAHFLSGGGLSLLLHSWVMCFTVVGRPLPVLHLWETGVAFVGKEGVTCLGEDCYICGWLLHFKNYNICGCNRVHQGALQTKFKEQSCFCYSLCQTNLKKKNIRFWRQWWLGYGFTHPSCILNNNRPSVLVKAVSQEWLDPRSVWM